MGGALIDRLESAIEREMNRDFDVWLERWCTPAGCYLDAPEPPASRYKTSPRRIARTIIKELRNE